MALKKVEVEVSANMYDVSKALAGFAGAVKEALDDGFQVDQDIAKLVPALLPLVGEVKKLSEVDDELKADPAAWVKALVVGGADLAELFKKKEPTA